MPFESDEDNSLSEAQDDAARGDPEDRPRTPVSFLTGRAGTGKTYDLLREAASPDSKTLLTATTGIAAVNLGATTINAALRYFDITSLRESYRAGRLQRTLRDIAETRRVLAIDEGSMLEADALDIIYRAVSEANDYAAVKTPLALRIVGDFAQLPPVQGRWAFEADCWEHFAKATTRLTRVWRQDGGAFLDALNAAREGNGGLAAEMLTGAGAEWHSSREESFDGTTILAVNREVNTHNATELMKVREKLRMVKSERWGKQRAEWGENQRTHEWGIPPTLELKKGAYVMLLANSLGVGGAGYCNGDCGHVVEVGEDYARVLLARTFTEVTVFKTIRNVEIEDEPIGFDGPKISKGDVYDGWLTQPHFVRRTGRYVVGQVRFLPMRLAWASTVHKSQGLSLDRVQIDFRHRFYQSPAMLYVALSRCRSLEGLRLVGQREVFAQRCRMDERVRGWV